MRQFEPPSPMILWFTAYCSLSLSHSFSFRNPDACIVCANSHTFAGTIFFFVRSVGLEFVFVVAIFSIATTIPQTCILYFACVRFFGLIFVWLSPILLLWRLCALLCLLNLMNFSLRSYHVNIICFLFFFSYCLILFHTQQTSMAIHCDFMRVRRRRRNVLYAFFGDCLSPEWPHGRW